MRKTLIVVLDCTAYIETWCIMTSTDKIVGRHKHVPNCSVWGFIGVFLEWIGFFFCSRALRLWPCDCTVRVVPILLDTFTKIGYRQQFLYVRFFIVTSVVRCDSNQFNQFVCQFYPLDKLLFRSVFWPSIHNQIQFFTIWQQFPLHDQLLVIVVIVMLIASTSLYSHQPHYHRGGLIDCICTWSFKQHTNLMIDTFNFFFCAVRCNATKNGLSDTHIVKWIGCCLCIGWWTYFPNSHYILLWTMSGNDQHLRVMWQF